MTLTAIIILIFLGFVLLLLEFLVIPGTTIAGIGGAILIAVGIYFSYITFGKTTGHIILLSTIVSLIITLIFSLKSSTWNKMMLNTEIQGKMNVIDGNLLSIGETGKSVTRLNPIGKAIFNNIEYEVKTNSEFIDQNKEIVIVKILPNQLIVKLKT